MMTSLSRIARVTIIAIFVLVSALGVAVRLDARSTRVRSDAVAKITVRGVRVVIADRLSAGVGEVIRSASEAIEDSSRDIAGGAVNWRSVTIAIHRGELPGGNVLASVNGQYWSDASIHLREGVKREVVLHEFGHHLDSAENTASPLGGMLADGRSLRDLRDEIFAVESAHAGSEPVVRLPGCANRYASISDKEDFATTLELYRYNGARLRALVGTAFTSDRIAASGISTSALLDAGGWKRFSRVLKDRLGVTGRDATLLAAKYLFMRDHIYKNAQF